MNELIKVHHKGDGNIIVSGRELHKFLELTERFAKWFDKMISFGFEDGVDYTGVKTFTPTGNGGRQELQDYALTIDMAKELAMIQRNDKGKQARRYFIEVEKRHTKMLAQTEQPKQIEKSTNLSIEDGMKMMELISNAPAHAVDAVTTIAMSFMAEIIPTPIVVPKETPEPIEQIPKKRAASPAGRTIPFNAKKLLNHLAKNGISHGDFAQMSGTSRSVLSNSLTGKSTPGFESRAKWCVALGKPVNWLNGGA